MTKANSSLTYVVTEDCVGCMSLACTRVCPVLPDPCFHIGPRQLVIDPHRCIECGQCAPECPADAIVHHDDASPEAIGFNATYAAIWPVAASSMAAGRTARSAEH
jgi:ferredoxin